MDNYIRNKLTLKINLVMSAGKKTEGVVSAKVILNLLKRIDGLGKYEIVYKGNLPIDIFKISDDYNVEFVNGKYRLTRTDSFIILSPDEYIHFDVKEYRNLQLNKLLN
jgi:hypothetical protein